MNFKDGLAREQLEARELQVLRSEDTVAVAVIDERGRLALHDDGADRHVHLREGIENGGDLLSCSPEVS